jgi:hypothetical protein
MESTSFDALARTLAQPAESRRRLLGAAVAGVLGAAGVLQVVRGVDARSRCPNDKRPCGRGCCPGKAPKCCKTYCCRKGYSCCGNKKCCK